MENDCSTQRMQVQPPWKQLKHAAPAPNALGPKMAPKNDQVTVGYDVDVLALKRNPLTDIWLLAGAENLNHVWKAGKLHKAPGMKL